ncbi:MAG: hypothetical protein ACREOU_07250 [Candidatus Eiseniibacteriota bacterium]
MTKSSSAALALALAIALSGAGCGLFDTAQPEPPTTGDGGLPPDFTTPESTLATLARSVHDRNVTNYGQCIADTVLESREFFQEFDPADATAWLENHPDLPVPWIRERELTFFNQFIANSDFSGNFYDVYFSPDPRGDVNISDSKRILNRIYRVWSGNSPVCAGSAGFTLERIGLAGDFKITYWEDRRDTADVRTWGTARLNGR